MAFPSFKCNNDEIDAAGIILADNNSSTQQIEKAKKIINYWRGAHYYPISTIQQSIRNKAYPMDEKCIVIQRLKKMQSIKGKLERRNLNLIDNLSQMQDIGGCRAIMSNKELVFCLVEKFKKSSWKHELVRVNDYIKSPKRSGYRGIHLVYKYKSKQNCDYNDMQIELQVRTYLQHIWATAVETTDVFTKNALKAGAGTDEWTRFFQLMSSMFAHEEDCKCVPHTPHSNEELVNDIKQLNLKYGLLNQLKTFNISSKHFSALKNSENHYYLLVLDNATKQLEVIELKKLSNANEQYLKYEDDTTKNAVLVSGDSLESLRKAYPNYFIDIKEFTGYLEKYLFL